LCESGSPNGRGQGEGRGRSAAIDGARRFGIARKPGRDELLERLRSLRGRLPADFVFDRDEANER